ncbi:MAG: hypothetical protein AUH83_15775 [Deltaproteobacteria bacterium 13_1_40CM_4_68_19]|nr:MAG: hypothetical protein AUH83_15775 [Deltaproteobacteria bacterium 13_1_40CM_4_68_19]OLD09329.1 MAG: hypothetical protein AUI90_04525 [Deltaproteobacteria bacterium 13_1_40CM_3_69_14]
MSGERLDMDPAAQVAAELRARLRSMGSDELVELCAQLLSTYVMEGVLPLSRAGESTDLAPDAVGEESFAQMLKRLKAARKDPVLDRFIIDGENISVRIEGQGVLPLTEYRRPLGPPASGPGVSVQVVARREAAPGAAGSIYNRSLYQPEAPAAARTTPQPPRPAAVQPGQPAQSGQQPPAAAQQKKPEEPRSDRFSLIELE